MSIVGEADLDNPYEAPAAVPIAADDLQNRPTSLPRLIAATIVVAICSTPISLLGEVTTSPKTPTAIFGICVCAAAFAFLWGIGCRRRPLVVAAAVNLFLFCTGWTVFLLCIHLTLEHYFQKSGININNLQGVLWRLAPFQISSAALSITIWGIARTVIGRRVEDSVDGKR